MANINSNKTFSTKLRASRLMPLLIAVIMMVGFPSFAQKSNFINISGGFEKSVQRDKGMSPLMYSGSGFFTQMAFYKESEKQSLLLALNFVRGTQRSKYGNSIGFNRGSIRIFNFCHKDKKLTNKLHWGLSTNNVFSHRYNPEFVNFNDHFEYFTNLGPAAKYLYPFKIKGRNLIMEGLAHIQLIGFMIRPSYTSSYPEGFLREQPSIFNGLVNSVKVYHPGNAWNFGFRPKLNYPLKSGNRISLGYQYEFYKLNTPNAVTQSSGIWFISLFTRI
ncbi:MAG: hypothetical protein WD426_06680 [Anditalea sp.]